MSGSGKSRKGLLERLREGPVLGDGGMTFTMEKRGYVKLGVWTPECAVLYPNAVRELHTEFARAGADVCQSMTFRATTESFQYARDRGVKIISERDINLAAVEIAREVANKYDNVMSVSLSESREYKSGKGREAVIAAFQQQLQFFVDDDCDVDYIVCEYFPNIEEMEWAIEAAKEVATKLNIPVAATMCVGPEADKNGVPPGECAVRMCRAGADIVGANCNFGPKVILETMRKMKTALDEAGLKPFLMCQPLGFFTPDVTKGDGYLQLPELYLAMEPRTITRFEAQKYAREAFELGVRYIGGCCGFEPHHIRAMSEELKAERGGRDAPVTEQYGDILSGLREHYREITQKRADPEYWRNMEPHTGRPNSAAMAKKLFEN